MIENNVSPILCVTTSNSVRRHSVREYLLTKVGELNTEETLNRLLADVKTRSFLMEGGAFDGFELSMRLKRLHVRALSPTDAYIRMIDFNTLLDVKSNASIITFRAQYIVDGHNRWITNYLVDPSTELICLDFDSDDYSSDVILKKLQPYHQPLDISNCFFNDDTDMESVLQFVNGHVSKDVVDYFLSMKIIDRANGLIDTRDKVVNLLANRIIHLRCNNSPDFAKTS